MAHQDDSEDITGLEQLIERIDSAVEQQQEVSVDDIMDMVGRRSFGPLLLVAGLLTLAPVIGDIPGAPTVIGLFVLLIAVELLLGHDHFWLPQWLSRRSVQGDSLKKGLAYLYRPARFIDRFIRPRFIKLVNGYTRYLIALTSIGIALCMPIMEVVPFSANAAGIVLTGFGLSLIGRDGLLTVLSFTLAAATYALVVFGVL